MLSLPKLQLQFVNLTNLTARSLLTHNSSKPLKSLLLTRNVISSGQFSHQYNKSSYEFEPDHPYKQVFPWKSLNDLVDILHGNIAYQDKNFVILDKPWGLGLHKANVRVHKKNADIIEWVGNFGNPKFCLMDAMPLLCEKLNLPNLQLIQSLSRFDSGLLVFGKHPQAGRILNKYKKRALTTNRPYINYVAICRGSPSIPGGFIQEKVCLRMLEIDELGDYKEPVIVYNASQRSREKFKMKTSIMSMKVLDVNKQLATSLVEIRTNKTLHDFIRAYAASKASFILGDVKFAKRVKEILGVPVELSPKLAGRDGYEPLHFKVLQRLSVQSNSNIPLLSHMYKLNLYGDSRSEDVEIRCNNLPLHFDWTLQKLNLHFDSPNITNQNEK